MELIISLLIVIEKLNSLDFHFTNPIKINDILFQ